MATAPLSSLLHPDVIERLVQLKEFAVCPRWSKAVGAPAKALAWLAHCETVLVLTAAGEVLSLGMADGRVAWESAPGNEALCMSVCPTAPLVAIGYPNGKLCLRDAATGELVSEKSLGVREVEQVSWSPNGQLLAASSGDTLYVLDSIGQVLAHHQESEAAIETLCWRPDSGALAMAGALIIRLFPIPARLRQLVPFQTLPESDPLLNLAWSPTGHHLATSRLGGCLSSWQMSSWLLPKTLRHRQGFGHGGMGRNLSWHHQGGWIATDQGANIGIWRNNAPGVMKHPRWLLSHQYSVQQVAFQRRGDVLASTDAGGVLSFWNPLLQSTPLLEQRLDSVVTALSWVATDSCLAVGTASGQVLMLDITH